MIDDRYASRHEREGRDLDDVDLCIALEQPNRDGDLTLPIVETEVKPTYTAAAMQAKIEGSIFMNIVVLASGRVGEVTVTKSLDAEHGLDQQAVDAARQWTFKPGMKDGQAVNVEVTLEMIFTLRK